MFASLGIRILAGLVVVTVLLTGAAPIAAHLCEMDGHGIAVPDCCAGHMDSGQEEDERCPMQTPGNTEAPLTAVCCTGAPAVPVTERVATMPSPTPDPGIVAVPLADWLVPPAQVVRRQEPLSTVPPVPPLRPHLTFSVLLI